MFFFWIRDRGARIKTLRIVASLLALAFVGACNPVATTQSLPFRATVYPLVRPDLARYRNADRAPAGTRYLYVADARTIQGGGDNELLVYDLRNPSAGPVRTVLLATEPAGVIVDPAGDVYVADGSEVLVFAPGAVDLLRSITAGVNAASGLAIDEHGDLYVANRGTKSGDSYVSEYAAGSRSPRAKIDVPDQFLVDGIAIDAHGDLYASIQKTQGAFLVQLQRHGQAPKLIDGMAGMGGVAVSPSGQLVAGAVGFLATYAGPPWRRIQHEAFRLQSIRLLTIASDGTLVVPMRQTLPAPSVIVEHPGSIAHPIVITQGLHAPNGAAVSPH